jgi:hypothetical protein
MWNLVRSVSRQCKYQCKIGVQFVPSIHSLEKSFWTHPMVLLGDEAQVEAQFSAFRDSANLTQDRCTVCAKHTIGSEIVLDAPDGTPR